MIPLEKHVVSLELAKRLKALGVKQASLFYYRRHHLHDMYAGYEEKHPPEIWGRVPAGCG